MLVPVFIPIIVLSGWMSLGLAKKRWIPNGSSLQGQISTLCQLLRRQQRIQIVYEIWKSIEYFPISVILRISVDFLDFCGFFVQVVDFNGFQVEFSNDI